ncbi:unnamed protein product [Vitrella brassicaformis CCMP3155]|uniref:Homoserine kinase n=1 Tax=Vitrella brassicaformis (strain CCMP3155) TaxID=1169540 RepID=A0A0G4EDC7_VITBC|nr:unnamed protein product [Vitrella brassicaformis CCMP3155]|eukprot:CEL93998.1 unnamed protein product [Vitrella brassicaformis CCMP3155]
MEPTNGTGTSTGSGGGSSSGPTRRTGERQSVTVRVPATSANVGSGFDCIGLALDIWNDLTVERSDVFEIAIDGEGAERLPRDESNLVVTGMRAAFKTAGKPVPTLKYTCVNRIPFARGLGSSSAAIVSGLVAGLVLTGHELPVEGEEALLQLACGIEGHPDNVAPAIYGGLQIGVHTGDRWYTSRIQMGPGLQAVLFLPDHILETSAARAVLPDKVPRKDAIFNVSRAALLANAFATGNMKELQMAMEDSLHQPYRAAQNPHLYPLVAAAIKAGSHGACLSGAGPAIFALTSGAKGDIYSQRKGERAEQIVADCMLKAAEETNAKGRIFITSPTERGAHVVSADPPFSDLRVLHFSTAGTPL